MIENIDIGGPTLIRAAAKNHEFAAVVVSPESYDAVLDELRESEGRLSGRTRQSLALEAFAYTARYDTAIARWFAEREDDFPAQYTMSLEKVARSALRREPAPARRVLRRGGRPHAPAVDGVEAPRQGAVVQQPARPRLRAPARGGVRAARGGDHQAQQPVRRGGGRAPRRRVRAGAGHRPPERVRRGVLLQPRGRARARRAAQLDVRRGGVRARVLATRRSRSSRRSPTCGSWRTRSAAARRSPSTTCERVRGGLLVQDRDAGLETREEMRVVTERTPERAGVGRAAVRDGRLQARALERDRARRRDWPRRASAPAR